MISLTFLVGVLGLLFVIGYTTRRRFGVLGLSLAAGSLLSTNWAGTVTPFIERQGVILVSPPLEIVVQVALIILPPIILLFSGPTYEKGWPRVIGAAAFALLAFAFMIQPLSLIMQLDTTGQQIFSFLKTYQSILIVAGMIGAIIDTLLTGRHHKH